MYSSKSKADAANQRIAELEQLTPSHAAILFTLEPVFAVATSYVVLGERLGMRSLLGAALVLAGILAAELLGPPAAPESPEPTGEPHPS